MYVKLARAFGINEQITIGPASPEGQILIVGTPTTESPEDMYYVTLWNPDLSSADSDNPFTADQVVECSSPDPVTVGADFVMDFYE